MLEDWCTCGNPSGEAQFHNPEEDGEEGSEYWTCEDCGGIIHIG